MVNDGMVIDVVDHSDMPIGVTRRDEVFEKRANFRVTHTLIFNSSGELLVQQLARTRERHPGYWGSSVAAYIFAGESYLTAASRRLREELAIASASLTSVGKFSMEDDGCQKFVGVFLTIYDGPFSFDRNHIESLEFLPRHAIRELQSAGARKFTPTFLKVLNFYESRM